jgi:hypothetical protein
MPMRDSDDGLEMTEVPGIDTRNRAGLARELLLSCGIPALLTGEPFPTVRVPRRFVDEATQVLEEQPDPVWPISMFWAIALTLVGGTAALLVAVWVLDQLIGVFR